MFYQQKDHDVLRDKLMELLKPMLRLTEDESNALAERLDDYVNAVAEYHASQALDREFNRGDWRY